jgi:hypothetical protein
MLRTELRRRISQIGINVSKSMLPYRLILQLNNRN